MTLVAEFIKESHYRQLDEKVHLSVTVLPEKNCVHAVTLDALCIAHEMWCVYVCVVHQSVEWVCFVIMIVDYH